MAQLHLSENFRNYLEAKFSKVWSPKSLVPPEKAIELFLTRMQITDEEGRESLRKLLEKRIKTMEKAQFKWEQKQKPRYLQLQKEIERIANGGPSGFSKVRMTMRESK